MADITIPTELLRIVDDHGLMTLEMASFINLVGALAIAEGTGSPEGVLAAKVSKLYMDTDGVTGAILYIKRVASIGGIASLGWVLV